MTESQRATLDRARTRIARLQPDVIAAVLAMFRSIAIAVTEAELVRFIAAGGVERVVQAVLTDALIERATLPVRLSLREAVATAFRWNVPYLPKGGKINGRVSVFFDHLNPRVLDALQSLETPIVTTLAEDVRATAVQVIARGLEHGQSHATIARAVRSAIGLSPRGEAAVTNFARMLREGDRTALSRVLRDRRFDQALERALGPDGNGVTAAQVETMTSAYRRGVAASEAENVSRAATHSAYKTAQLESWQSAIERGIVPQGVVRKRWLHLDAQPDPRPHHAAMQGETVPIDAPYSNGDTFAGENDPWNCRCLDIYSVA